MIKEQNQAIKSYLSGLQLLKQLGVLRNSKDFTGQLGEWLASNIYGGTLSDNGIEKYWDFEANGLKYQVKTHAKAPTTNRKSTDIKADPNSNVDRVIIIVFSDTYKLIKFYDAPWTKCLPLIKNGSLSWKKIDAYQVDIATLPQEYVETFL